jgi:hypothetical protein
MRTESWPQPPSIGQLMGQPSQPDGVASPGRSRRNTAISQQHNPVSDDVAADAPMPDVPGAPVLSPKVKEEVARNNKVVKTCIVQSTWTPANLQNVGNENI